MPRIPSQITMLTWDYSAVIIDLDESDCIKWLTPTVALPWSLPEPATCWTVGLPRFDPQQLPRCNPHQLHSNSRSVTQALVGKAGTTWSHPNVRIISSKIDSLSHWYNTIFGNTRLIGCHCARRMYRALSCITAKAPPSPEADAIFA